MNTGILNPELSPDERSKLLLARIAAHPFLRGLRPEHLQTLATCCMAIEFQAGEVLFRAGDIANRFYLIESGTVDLEAVVDKDRGVLIETLGPGEILGRSWLFEPYTWQLRAMAREPVKALFFYGTRLRERCEAEPEFGNELNRRVSEVAIHRLSLIRRKLVEFSATALEK